MYNIIKDAIFLLFVKWQLPSVPYTQHFTNNTEGVGVREPSPLSFNHYFHQKILYDII